MTMTTTTTTTKQSRSKCLAVVVAAATTATAALVVATIAMHHDDRLTANRNTPQNNINNNNSRQKRLAGVKKLGQYNNYYHLHRHEQNIITTTANNGGAEKELYRSTTRPAIPDDIQAEKIRSWNKRLLEELLHESSSSSSSSSSSGRRRQNRRLDSTIIDNHHSKASDSDEEILADSDLSSHPQLQSSSSLQSQPPPPPQQQQQFQQQMHLDKGPPLNQPQTLANENDDETGGDDSSSNSGNYYNYYPMYTSTLTIGTCTNNGNEPDRYHESSNPEYFLFDTLEECCQAWYVDVVGCTVGNAFPSGESELLLVRDTVTGELLSSGGTGGKTTSMTTTTTTTPASSTTTLDSSGGGGDGSNENENMEFNNAASGQNVGSTSNNQYYPSFDTVTYPDGACLNDGNAPVEFMANPTNFFYGTDHECCEEWFLDVDACLDGATMAGKAVAAMAGSGNSSKENEHNDEEDEDNKGEEADEQEDEDNNEKEDSNKEQDDDGTLWPTWADDEVSAESGSQWPTWADDDIKVKEDAMVNIGAEAGTLWPTWSTADVVDDTEPGNEGEDDMSSVAAEITLSAPDVPDDTTATQSNMNISPEEYALYDSFETGDFTKYDWGTPTHNPSVDDFTLGSYSDSDSRNIDAWEVDRTSMAYDGNYAARAGMLRSPGSQSNMTITLEGVDVSRGGLLTYAIRAMVEMPMDVLYLTIDDEVVRTYDKVTIGDSEDGNEWEEDSLMLLPGQHVVTWSYQYFGAPKEGDPYEMDPRRVGNSWVDAIALVPLTGDIVWPDSGEGAQMILKNSRGGNDVAHWSLVTDAHAFLGDHSFIAYTKDIASSTRNYAEISWTVIAGPAGGVLSFATFGSVFAPIDILEFRVDGVPQVALTVPTSDWEEHYINIEPGKHSLKWRLLKNAPGLSDEIIDGLDLPVGYQGYAKIDGIKYVDNQVFMTSTTSTSASIISSVLPVSTTTASAKVASTTEVASTTKVATTTEVARTTTKAPPTTTATTVATDELSGSTGEAPMEEATAEVVTSTTSTTTVATDPTTTTTSAEPIEEQGSKETGCPEGLKPVDGLPNCCLEEPNYLGDGACDPSAPYNTEECAFDLGDCCYETCNKYSPYGCLTVEGNAEEVGPFGFFCLDPRYSIIDVEKCQVENRGWIGDGGCDAEGGYNTEECGWDMGDCCEETCNEEFSFYPCGSHQPYTCMNPQYLEEEGASGAADNEKSNATDAPPTTTTVNSEGTRSSTTTSGMAETETASTTTTKPSEDPENTSTTTVDPGVTSSATSAMETTSTTTIKVTSTTTVEPDVTSSATGAKTTSTPSTPSEDTGAETSSTTQLPSTTEP